MRLIFAGTPDFAASALLALIQAGHEILLVLTQPDRPAGRGMQLKHSAVKDLALLHQLSIAQPSTLKDPQFQADLRSINADLMIVAAYGLILPQAVLDIPRLGCLNIHASLLPRWRGAAPIQRALLADDKVTGITIMQMDAGLDTGAMLLQKSTPISTSDTAHTLHDKLATLGATCIVEAVNLLPCLNPVVQNDAQATYAAKISKEEARINWSRPAADIERAIRAYNPFPCAYTLRNGEPLKLWDAQVNDTNGAPGAILKADNKGILVGCGRGALRITELQRAGGKRLRVAQFLAGVPIALGEYWF